MSDSTLVVKGIYSNLAKIGEFAVDFSTRVGLDDRSVYAVQMAVDEACTNIIKHSYGGEGKGDISLQFLQMEDVLKVIIQDQGNPFDPDTVPEPNIHAPIEERPEGGLGLFLMRQLMDVVTFNFSGGAKGDTNTLTLVKHIKS